MDSGGVVHILSSLGSLSAVVAVLVLAAKIGALTTKVNTMWEWWLNEKGKDEDATD